MTKFENDLLIKLLIMKEKEEEVKEKYKETKYEGFKELGDHASELKIEIMASKRW